MCSSAVRNARVPEGIANRSRNPNMAAASAPSTPMAMSHSALRVRKPGSSATCEEMSNTKLVIHAPMGMETSIGCHGCPYGPASRADTGCLPQSPGAFEAPGVVGAVDIGTHLQYAEF